MTDSERIRKYYRPRVLLDVGNVLDNDMPDVLVCLSGGQVDVLRNLLAYAHRKSSWVSEYGQSYYLSPSDSEWDDVQGVIAELEFALMAGCDDIVAALQDMVTQLSCICTAQSSAVVLQQQQLDAQIESLDSGRWGPTLAPVVEDYLGDGVLVPGDDNGNTVPVDANRCALAQLAWAFAYEMLTETIQPVQNNAVDILLPAAMGVIGFMIGGPVVGVPAAAITALLSDLADIAVEGQLIDLQNDLFAAKEELVCAVYSGLETDYRAAEAEAADIINDLPAASPIDKVVLRGLFAPWAFSLCETARSSGSAWATNNVTAGYCDSCDIVEGDGWFAVKSDLEIDVLHPSGGGYWERVSACGPFYGTSTVIGYVLEKVSETGDCQYVTDGDATDCTGTNISVNSSIDMSTIGSYYFYKDLASLDESVIVAVLSPGATMGQNQCVYPVTGPGDWRVSVRGGYGCVGDASFVVRWVVYQGTP